MKCFDYICKSLQINLIPLHYSFYLLQKIMNNMDRVTTYWDFIKSLEPPRGVHVRQGDILAKDNTFAQVTVRFFSQQVCLFLFNPIIRSVNIYINMPFFFLF